MRVVFIGTGDIAIPSFRWLLGAPAVEVVALVTQPDKPAEDIQLKKAVEVLTVGLQAAKKSDPKIAAQNPDKIAGPGGREDAPPTTTTPADPGRLNIPRPKK